MAEIPGSLNIALVIYCRVLNRFILWLKENWMQVYDKGNCLECLGQLFGMDSETRY
jgi:hypothetical protein